jgi:hypothetical protein
VPVKFSLVNQIKMFLDFDETSLNKVKNNLPLLLKEYFSQNEYYVSVINREIFTKLDKLKKLKNFENEKPI